MASATGADLATEGDCIPATTARPHLEQNFGLAFMGAPQLVQNFAGLDPTDDMAHALPHLNRKSYIGSSKRSLAHRATLLLVNQYDATVDVIPAYEMSLFAGLAALDILLFPIYIANPFGHDALLCLPVCCRPAESASILILH